MITSTLFYDDLGVHRHTLIRSLSFPGADASPLSPCLLAFFAFFASLPALPALPAFVLMPIYSLGRRRCAS